MLKADASDLGGSGGPWWVSAGGVGIAALTAIGSLVLQRWRDRSAAGQTPPGLNAPVVATVTETTRPHGMTGVQLSTMLQTVDLLSDRLETVEGELANAKKKIAELERHDTQKQWALDEAIRLYINAEGKPPRLVPEYLLPYITKPPTP